MDVKMERKYLIVKEESLVPEEIGYGDILYAGEGSFNDWKEKIGRAPRSDRIYRLENPTKNTY